MESPCFLSLCQIMILGGGGYESEQTVVFCDVDSEAENPSM